MTFGELIISVAEGYLGRQDPSTGAMPAGYNGPYNDPETPVRNTAHWLQTFILAHDLSGDGRFYKAAESCMHYLIGSDVPRCGHSYQHRNKEGKDQCNGLIGQAWTIEALVKAYEYFEVEDCLGIAKEIFIAHPFSETMGLWNSLEPDGTVLTVDPSFNHQLWFCAAGTMVANHGSPVINGRTTRFLSAIPRLMETSKEGRIGHVMKSAPGRIRRNVARTLFRKRRVSMMSKEVGYQTFNLYAFAMLKAHIPDHEIWHWPGFCRALEYLSHSEFKENISGSPYGFYYNAPGFEIPVILQAFNVDHDYRIRESQFWLKEQLQRHYDWSARRFVGSAVDAETLNARFYECTRFPPDIFALDFSFD